jgi:thioredoxin 1
MKKTTQITGLTAGILTIIMLISCINPSKNNNLPEDKPLSDLSVTSAVNANPTDTTKPDKVYKVTFVELGSTRCIPCQKMQPVMKSVEQKSGDQVKVIFHDVWTKEGEPFGEQFGISAIPTQVFLDASGKEYFRHEGYFPEEELVKILFQKGVK